MYVVFATIGTGGLKSTCCHPEGVSLTKVACARSVPSLRQRLPTCVPPFAVDLKKRTLDTSPPTSVRNLTPSSTACQSLLTATVGTVLAVHALHGQLPAVVGGDATPPPESAAPCTLTLPAL